MEYLVIDGSYGEGGGQILRTSAALSAISKKPLEVVNIRAKRESPGLRPQHLTAVRVLAEVFDASVENLRIGADWIRFAPREARPGFRSVDIGSAGSITLLLQALIPAAALSGIELDVEVVGGTDVRWSPTTDYARHVLLPAYGFLGVDVDLTVSRRGYYPQGGGRVRARVKPCKELRPLSLREAAVKPPSLISVCSNLSRGVAERQAAAAAEHLRARGVAPAGVDVSVEGAVSPGSSIVVYSVEAGGPYVGGDSIGERGKPAERVGREAAQNFYRERALGVPVDRHLADMLVVVLACIEGESVFRTSEVTQHLATGLHVARLFTGCRYRLEELGDGSALVSIQGASPR